MYTGKYQCMDCVSRFYFVYYLVEETIQLFLRRSEDVEKKREAVVAFTANYQRNIKVHAFYTFEV